MIQVADRETKCNVMNCKVCCLSFSLEIGKNLLNVGANHILNVLDNTIWLTLCILQNHLLACLSFCHKTLDLTRKTFTKCYLPTATFVRPGRSMSVKLTTAKAQAIISRLKNNGHKKKKIHSTVLLSILPNTPLGEYILRWINSYKLKKVGKTVGVVCVIRRTTYWSQ